MVKIIGYVSIIFFVLVLVKYMISIKITENSNCVIEPLYATSIKERE